MKKVAIVDKYPNNTNYSKYFDFIEDFDILYMAEKDSGKLLKKDIILTKEELEEYGLVILVGADASKVYAGVPVTTHTGVLIDSKWVPIMSPNMLVFKPEFKPKFEKAIESIKSIYNNNSSKVEITTTIIDDEDDAILALENLLNTVKSSKNTEYLAVDTETTALYPRDGYLLGVSLTLVSDINTGYYISSDVITDSVHILLSELLSITKVVFHNAKFDIKFLSYHLGLDFKHKDVSSSEGFDDTMLLHYVLDENNGHGLKQLAIEHTNLGDYDSSLDSFKREYCKKNKVKLSDFSYDLIPFDILGKYAAIDTIATATLYKKFYPVVKKNKDLNRVYKNLLIRGTKLAIIMEENGVPFNRQELEKAQKEITNDLFNLTEKLNNSDGVKSLTNITGEAFNPNSVIQVRQLLFDILGLPIPDKKTGTGAISVDAEVLENLASISPEAELILKIKKLKKIKSTYIDKILVHLDQDGRLRTNFNLTTTTSGRLSSSGKLNMQQLPRDNKVVKRCIQPPSDDYVVVSQDLGTAEMYVAAVLSGDRKLQKVFINKQNGKGADFHSTIAHMVFHLPCKPEEVKKLYPHLRQAAKAISFGILYGSGPAKVAATVNKDSAEEFTLEDAEDAIRKYFKMFPKLKNWLDKNKEFIKKHGFVYSIFGRKRRLPNVFSSSREVVGHEIRSGINFLIQSVASDINLLAAIDIQQYILDNSIRAEIFGLVHDSILAIVHKSDLEEYLDISKKLTQQDFGVSIPNCPISIDQEVGTTYAFEESITI